MTDAPLFSDPALREAGAIRVREERTAGDVLATAIRLAISEARPFFTALFAIVGPMVVAGALVRLAAGTPGELVGTLVDAAANLLATASALGFARLYVRGGPLEVADVWDEARGLLGLLFRFVLVLMWLAFVLIIPVALLVSAVGGGSMAGAGSVVGAGVVALAALFVVSPLVSLALVAVGLDEMRPLEALRRARDLARPHLGLVALTLVLVAGVSVFALVVVGGLFGALFAAGVADPASAASRAVPAAIGTLLVLPVGAVMTLVWVVLYGSLVEMEEGASLGAGLDDLAGVLDDRPGDRPAPHDTSRVDPADVARPLGRERPSGDSPSGGRDALLDEPDAPPADPPRGFRGGGFSGGAP